MKPNLTFSKFHLMIFTSILLSSCTTSPHAKQIAKYATTLDSSSSTISKYYTELNQFERRVYLNERIYNLETSISLINNGKPTPLQGAFSKKSLKARTDSIKLLASFASKLNSLASSSGSDFQTASLNAGTSYTNLSSKFRALSRGGDSSANTYIKPVSQIVGLLGKSYINLKRDAALRQIIIDSEKPTLAILEQLKKDLDKYGKSLRTAGLKQILSTQISYYNTHKSTMSLSERNALVTQINDLSLSLQIEPTASVLSLISSIEKTHKALVKSARSNFSADFDSFTLPLSEAITHLQEVVEATKDLKQ